MGLPLRPTFTNICMCFHETKWLLVSDWIPTYVLQTIYIDDTFLLFHDETHAPMFLNYLNNKHANIKFTIECKHSNKLSFLDCTVHKIDNKFQCSVFRKGSFSGLLTSFFSNCTFRFKLNGKSTLYCHVHIGCVIPFPFSMMSSSFWKFSLGQTVSELPLLKIKSKNF